MCPVQLVMDCHSLLFYRVTSNRIVRQVDELAAHLLNCWPGAARMFVRVCVQALVRVCACVSVCVDVALAHSAGPRCGLRVVCYSGILGGCTDRPDNVCGKTFPTRASPSRPYIRNTTPQLGTSHIYGDKFRRMKDLGTPISRKTANGEDLGISF